MAVVIGRPIMGLATVALSLALTLLGLATGSLLQSAFYCSLALTALAGSLRSLRSLGLSTVRLTVHPSSHDQSAPGHDHHSPCPRS